MGKPQEIIETSDHRVRCNGGEGALGHPLIYLEFGPDKTKLECPYCSREFAIKDHK